MLREQNGDARITTSVPGVETSERCVVAPTRENSLQGIPPSEGDAEEAEPLEGTMNETSSSVSISTKLERIAKLARELRGVPLTTLAHHIDVDWLREAYRRTRKDGARGVDRQSAAQYGERLEENGPSRFRVMGSAA